jgi:hypothetical protein
MKVVQMIQLKPPNVITVNVIIRLMLSVLQRPGLLSQTSGEKATYYDRIHKISSSNYPSNWPYFCGLLAEFREKLILYNF